MRILVADDEEFARRMLTALLEKMGHVIQEYSSGDAVWKALQDSECPEFLVIDWNMPGLTGIDLCNRVKELSATRTFYTIMLTARSEKEDILGALRSGANDYLIKPINLVELQTRIAVGVQFLELKQSLQNQKIRLIHSAKLSSLGEMAGGIAHEVNNPLTIIGGLTHKLQRFANTNTLEASQVLQVAEKIERNVGRISNIIQAMLLFASESEAERMKHAKIGEIFNNLILFCKERFLNHHIELRFQISKIDTEIVCQPSQISQVLLCLLNNAHDAALKCKEKWVEITLEETSNDICIIVTDSGMGIDSKIRDKIFDPFFSTKEQGKYIGLGLSIAQGIVKAHQGSLYLDADSKDTRFVLQLPKNPSVKE